MMRRGRDRFIAQHTRPATFNLDKDGGVSNQAPPHPPAAAQPPPTVYTSPTGWEGRNGFGDRDGPRAVPR